MVVALVVVTLVVFGEVRDRQFLWDDDTNVAENAYLNPVTIPKVLHFWRMPYARLYIPLTYTVWSGLALVSGPAAPQGIGLKPRPFHIVNLIFHALSALVVFAILRLLVASDVASCAGAMLFALHPVQVEPVAWVTGLSVFLPQRIAIFIFPC
jgi:protein O-mannosyl-transferase